MFDELDISSLELINFMPHKSLKIKFPASGPFVVTGDTGSGKSSGVIEPIVYGPWWRLARTQFRENPIREGATEMGVRLTTKKHRIEHSRTGKRGISFTWNRKGEEPKIYSSPTKAQEALEKEIGPFSSWYWTHVFFSEDLDYFVNSRDSERKKLLEELLGWGASQFEQPLKRARAFLKDADTELSRLELDIATVKSRIQTLEEGDPQPPEPPPKPRVPKEKIDRLTKEARQLVESLADKQGEHGAEIGALRFQEQQLKKHLRLFEEGTCPTCQQDVGEEMIKPAQKKARQVAEQLRELEDSGPDVSDEEQALKLLQKEVADARQIEQQWDIYETNLESYKVRGDRLTAAQEKLARLLKERDDQAEVVDVSKDGVAALGPQGARAWAIDDVLSDINDASNDYLSILSPKLGVEIGSAGEDIYINILRGGGGKHRLVSQGEKQQVALAVRMAIAALRNDRGTLFFDEAMKSISLSNVDRMVDFINTVSVDRCAVVITHDARLAKELIKSGAKHLHFD